MFLTRYRRTRSDTYSSTISASSTPFDLNLTTLPYSKAPYHKYSYGSMLFPHTKNKIKKDSHLLHLLLHLLQFEHRPVYPVRTKTFDECCNLVRLYRVPLTILQAPGLTSEFDSWHTVLVLAHPTGTDDVILFFTSRTLHILIPTSRTLHDYHNWLLTVLYMGGQVP